MDLRRKDENGNTSRKRKDKKLAKCTPKPKRTTKIGRKDTIAKSKQLAAKMKSQVKEKTRNTCPKKNLPQEPRVCGNGKPMPSLAELEKMYEDSDEDETPSTSGSGPTVKPSTPEQPRVAENNIPLTPKSIKNLSEKMLDMITNMPDPSILIEDQPNKTVIPQKKRKKSGVPYIVGCKDRAQKIKTPGTANIGKGDAKYGVREQDSEEEGPSIPKRRKHDGDGKPISKSLFNAKSDEIAAMLLSQESDSSNDSNKTVTYDYETQNIQVRAFSPLPSTSHDEDTILKNDLRFNESLNFDVNKNIQSHVETLEKTCEIGKNIQSDVEIVETPCETVVIDDDDDFSFSNIRHKTENDVPEVIEIEHTSSVASTLVEDDLYSSVDLNISYETLDNEIIDVDVEEVLAENEALINKFQQKYNDDDCIVTYVQPGKFPAPKKEPVIEILSSINTQQSDVQRESICVEAGQHLTQIMSQPFIKSKPSVVTSEPSVVTSHASLVTSQPSMVTSQSSVVTSQPSLVTSQSSLVTSQPSMVTSQSSVVTSQPSTVTSQPQDTLTNCRGAIVVDVINPRPRSTQRPVNTLTSAGNLSSFIQTLVDTFKYTLDQRSKSQSSTTSSESRTGEQVIDNQLSNTNNNKNKSPMPKETQNRQEKNTQGGKIRECPICMESYTNQAVASTNCGHVFCLECIQKAIKASGKRCPSCRKALKGVGYHQLFF